MVQMSLSRLYYGLLLSSPSEEKKEDEQCDTYNDESARHCEMLEKAALQPFLSDRKEQLI
jgi:hypothetical protein